MMIPPWLMPFRSAASMKLRVIVSFLPFLLDRFDVKLRGNDARNLHELSIRHGGSILDARGCSITRAPLHIGNFADATLRNRADHCGGVANERADRGFARALGVRKKLAEDPNHDGRDHEGARSPERRADVGSVGGGYLMKDGAEAAEGRHERCNDSWAERGKARAIAPVGSGFGVASTPADVTIVSTAMVAGDGGDKGKQQSHSEADEVNSKFHKCSIGCPRTYWPKPSGQQGKYKTPPATTLA